MNRTQRAEDRIVRVLPAARAALARGRWAGNHRGVPSPLSPLPGPADGAGGPAPVGRGRLLVASPALSDPHFDRTVVVVLECDRDGALGLVLNRPTKIAVGDVVPAWGEIAAVAPPAVVFAGGPVSPEVAVGLARARGWDGAEWTTLVDGVGVVDLSGAPAGRTDGGSAATPAAGPKGLCAARVFAGYAGWGPGQLDDELAAGAWFVVDAVGDDMVGPDPVGLWRRVLRRQRGMLRLLASYPADPRHN